MAYNYFDSINILLNKFPVLTSIYQDNIYDYEGLPYVFYESVFVNYIMGKIRSFDESELGNIFIFIEELLLKGDKEIKILVDVAVIESLYFEETFNEFNMFLAKFYGDLTRKSLDDCLNG